jgi:hypothetical protein
MTQPHMIELALDLARMPALARSSVVPPLPPNLIELMRIAAASPEACQAAVVQTGEPRHVVIEAARFYLQQVLFRPDADCYRILGIQPAASRETARSHMRWLLEWLHPDRNTNNNSWDAVYAERVLKAWREVSSATNGSAAKSGSALARVSSNQKKKGRSQAIRLRWVEYPTSRSLAMRNPYRTFVLWAVPTGLVIIVLALWSANALLQP